LAPDHNEAHAQLGAFLVASGRVLEGTVHLRAALKSEPKHPLANFILGQLMAKNGRTTEARERYEDALAGQPSHPQELQIREALRLLPPAGPAK
jgi:Flp pilus assembly protein TadD